MKADRSSDGMFVTGIVAAVIAGLWGAAMIGHQPIKPTK